MQTPPFSAATWPSSEVPVPKAITGVLYAAQRLTIVGDLLGAVGKGDGVGGMRRVVGFVLAVLRADRCRGRQPVAEPLPQRVEQRGIWAASRTRTGAVMTAAHLTEKLDSRGLLPHYTHCNVIARCRWL